MQRSNGNKDRRSRLTIGQVVCIALVGAFFLVTAVRTARSETTDLAGSKPASDTTVTSSDNKPADKAATPEEKKAEEPPVKLPIPQAPMDKLESPLLPNPQTQQPVRRTLEFTEKDRETLVLRHPLMTDEDRKNINLYPLACSR